MTDRREMKRQEKERKEEGKPKSSGAPTEKKKRRFRLGTVVLWEIRRFQRSTGFLIQTPPFMQWVQEIMQEQCGDVCFQATAFLTLQEAVEAYVVAYSKAQISAPYM